MSWTPSLRTVLLIVNVVILAMPLGAIAALRIYDSELIRQTEAELIGQAAFVVASYRHALLEELEGGEVGAHALAAEHEIEPVDGKFIPVSPRLDVNAERVRSPADDPIDGPQPAPETAAAGERIEPILADAQQITFAGIRVVDVHGTIVASTRTEERGQSIAAHEEVRRALTGEFVSLLRQRISSSPRPPIESISRGTTVRVFVAMPIFVGDRVAGAVVLSRTPMSIMKALYTNRVILGLMLATLLAGVALITILTLVTIRNPIQALIDQTRRIAANPADAGVIEQPGTREFQELSEAFASMAAALREREAYITTFARSVSHEFKTPLTSIRGSIELLQDHLDEMEPGERDEFLDVVARDCERLDRLVGRLLELARADVLRPGGEASDVEAVARAIAQELETADFTVRLNSTLQDPAVGMGRETLEALFANLLGNARDHGATTARVEIREVDGEAEVVVTDDGPGIDPADAPRIFDTFFTTARERGGTGLGLSIVRTLVEAHGGSVELLQPVPATFRLRLPLRR